MLNALKYATLIFMTLPAFGALSLHGSCTSSSTACTVGAGGSGSSASGDLMIAFGERIASTTAPSLPASNTSIATSSGGATTSFRVWCHIASGTSDGTGTATNATGGVVAFWFSGASSTTTANCATPGVAIGLVSSANAQYSASGTSITVSGLNTSSGSSTSWIIAFTGTNTTGDACVPSSMTNPTTPAGYVQGGTTAAAITSWSSTTCTITSAVARSFALEILSSDSGVGSGTPVLVQSHDCTESWGPNANTAGGGSTWSCNLPSGTQAGNMILVNFTVDSGSPTIVDNKNDSYFLISHTGANGETVYTGYAPNVQSGAFKITITMTGTTPYGLPSVLEVAHVALSNPIDCSTGNQGNSTSVTFGSCTPTISGDFVFGWFWNDYTVSTTSLAAGSQTNITWGLCGPASYNWGVGAECGVYTSTASLNPAMTTGTAGFDGVVLFIKPSSSGNAPTGLRILAAKDMWMNSGNSAPWNATAMTVPFPCPSSGNAILAAGIGGGNGSLTFTSASDSHSNSYNSVHSAVVNDSYIQDYYAENATVSQDQTFTANVTYGGTNDITPIIYCIAGAKTSGALDSTSVSTGTGNQSSTTGTLATITYTPSVSGELIFAQTGVSFNTLNGLSGSGQIFHAGYNSAEALSLGGVNQNNGWGSVLDAGTTSQSFTWNQVSSSTATGNWAALALGIEPSSTTTTSNNLTLTGAGK